jgi:hypothetical protein
MSSISDILSLIPNSGLPSYIANGNQVGAANQQQPSFGGGAGMPADAVTKALGLGHQDTAQQIAKIAGGVAGNAILPGVGGMIGQVALPAVVGGVESILGGINKKKAQSYMPGMEDPMERRRLTELDNKRKTFETGSAYASQLKQLKNIQANSVKGATRASNGNTGALLNAISNIGLNAGDAYGKVAAEGTARQDNFDGQYGDMMENMAKRRATLQMQQYTQKSVDASEQKKSGNQTLMGVLALAQNFKNPQQGNNFGNLLQPDANTMAPLNNTGQSFDPYSTVNYTNPLNVPPLKF